MLFGRHCLRKVFQTLHDYDLAWGLAIHIRIDEFDLISRSQVCQNHKLLIVFRFLSTLVYGCMVAMHIKKIKQRMLCVTGVYLKDDTNIILVILHLNVSHLSVCSSYTFSVGFHFFFIITVILDGHFWLCMCFKRQSNLQTQA